MMEAFQFPVGYLWLAAGAFFLALEAFGAPGIGLAFAGLAAIIVGALIELDILGLTDFIWQFGLWFSLTTLLALALWKPLKQWKTATPGGETYQNIVGDTVTICDGDLVRGSVGHARWSGTIMLAELDPIADAVRMAEGEMAEITKIRGNTLYLRPYGSRRQEEIL